MNAEETYGTVAKTLPTFGFPKHYRLLHRKQFVGLAKQGRKIQNRHFIAYFCKNGLDYSRLGITVTRKVGHAATRNRIKRIAREYFRLHRRVLIYNWDINLIAKIEVSDISNKVIVISLENLFSRIAAVENE